MAASKLVSTIISQDRGFKHTAINYTTSNTESTTAWYGPTFEMDTRKNAMVTLYAGGTAPASTLRLYLQTSYDGTTFNTVSTTFWFDTGAVQLVTLVGQTFLMTPASYPAPYYRFIITPGANLGASDRPYSLTVSQQLDV